MSPMSTLSAGLLIYRYSDSPEQRTLEVLLVHPGGPFWKKKDDGAWSIPKGLVEPGEESQAAAAREFTEETGFQPPRTPWLDLGLAKLKSGKQIQAWAAEGDFNVAHLRSNVFSMEWPPKSGREQEFPEVDRALYVAPEVARVKLNEAQVVFVDRLLELLSS